MSGIAIVINNRSERGPLQSVVDALPEATVFGMSRVAQDGEPAAVMARGLEYFSDVLCGFKVVVLVGDRYETLAAALAAMFLRIRIVHIHGGETTTGAFDNALRHSITHLTQQSGGVHCVATDKAATRIAELRGTISWPLNLHLVGAPGLDGIPGNSARRDCKLILVTYHPETAAADYGISGCHAMLHALYPLATQYEIYFCGVNNDPGASDIRRVIQDFCQERGGYIRHTMNHAEYIALMQSASLVIGNSSAGIIEAPWVGIPSVNIGNRQDGRERAPSVFDVDAEHNISAKIEAALRWHGPWKPAYKGTAAPRISEIVRGMVK